MEILSIVLLSLGALAEEHSSFKLCIPKSYKECHALTVVEEGTRKGYWVEFYADDDRMGGTRIQESQYLEFSRSLRTAFAALPQDKWAPCSRALSLLETRANGETILNSGCHDGFATGSEGALLRDWINSLPPLTPEHPSLTLCMPAEQCHALTVAEEGGRHAYWVEVYSAGFRIGRTRIQESQYLELSRKLRTAFVTLQLGTSRALSCSRALSLIETRSDRKTSRAVACSDERSGSDGALMREWLISLPRSAEHSSFKLCIESHGDTPLTDCYALSVVKEGPVDGFWVETHWARNPPSRVRIQESQYQEFSRSLMTAFAAIPEYDGLIGCRRTYSLFEARSEGEMRLGEGCIRDFKAGEGWVLMQKWLDSLPRPIPRPPNVAVRPQANEIHVSSARLPAN